MGLLMTCFNLLSNCELKYKWSACVFWTAYSGRFSCSIPTDEWENLQRKFSEKYWSL